VKIEYSYNILLDLSQKSEERAAVVETDDRSPSTGERTTYRQVSEVPIRETSMTPAIRSMCFLPVNGCQYLESPSSVVGFLAIRISKGGTNIPFKRMEQRWLDSIHKDDENSKGITFSCRA
jgi:hypothetical protein